MFNLNERDLCILNLKERDIYTKRDTYIFEKTGADMPKTCVHISKERYISVKRDAYTL